MPINIITFPSSVKYLCLFFAFKFAAFQANAQGAKKESTDIPAITISDADIKKNSFFLYSSQRIFFAQDSTFIIVNGFLKPPSRLFFEHPLSHKIYYTKDLDNLPSNMSQRYSFSYLGEETEVLFNNAGEIRALFFGSGAYNNDKYLVSSLNKQAKKIIYQGQRTEFVINDINDVFFNESHFFVDDSLFVFEELQHYKITLKHKGKTLYSLTDTAEHTSLSLNNGKVPGWIPAKWKSYYPAHLFPCYGKLHFIKLPTESDKQTTLITYDLRTGLAKKYIFPEDVTGFIFAKDCIFVRLYFQNEGAALEDKSAYSYIPY
jgi:hypothetical protein